ncbi:hypothetical protein SSBR45G_50080 [Bradyrhizobium sp. SSBR45G]|nr:hypothetical protein SSBR45G_50080 [Bradyrhizobium sp. SSBR45G]GLH87592.1 hypothetical protein SSBR45R_50520 [Bradyrhizobium sp. SSBR45R]
MAGSSRSIVLHDRHPHPEETAAKAVVSKGEASLGLMVRDAPRTMISPGIGPIGAALLTMRSGFRDRRCKLIISHVFMEGGESRGGTEHRTMNTSRDASIERV